VARGSYQITRAHDHGAQVRDQSAWTRARPQRSSAAGGDSRGDLRQPCKGTADRHKARAQEEDLPSRAGQINSAADRDDFAYPWSFRRPLPVGPRATASDGAPLGALPSVRTAGDTAQWAPVAIGAAAGMMSDPRRLLCSVFPCPVAVPARDDTAALSAVAVADGGRCRERAPCRKTVPRTEHRARAPVPPGRY
jgi:hypothetical protein